MKSEAIRQRLLRSVSFDDRSWPFDQDGFPRSCRWRACVKLPYPVDERRPLSKRDRILKLYPDRLHLHHHQTEPIPESDMSSLTTTTTTTTLEPTLFKDAPTVPPTTPSTAHTLRRACRTGTHTTVTAGHAPGHLQANLLVLPSRYANDFRLLCARNPVPCPLIAESVSPGRFDRLKSCIPGLSDSQLVGDGDFDIRTDLPGYNIYASGHLTESRVPDIRAEWSEDHVAFLIGCSFSFESDLAAAGLTPAHVLQGMNCPMYRTSIPLCPAGVFRGGTYVVSMRFYPSSQIERVRDITRRFTATHGEPIDWGWEAVGRLGIGDLERPDWGDTPLSSSDGDDGKGGGSEGEGEVPVLWGCGVTPQEAVMRAGGALEGVVMAHSPGRMLVLDARDGDVRTPA